MARSSSALFSSNNEVSGRSKIDHQIGVLEVPLILPGGMADLKLQLESGMAEQALQKCLQLRGRGFPVQSLLVHEFSSAIFRC